jgi:hypothetical protein
MLSDISEDKPIVDSPRMEDDVAAPASTAHHHLDVQTVSLIHLSQELELVHGAREGGPRADPRPTALPVRSVGLRYLPVPARV